MTRILVAMLFLACAVSTDRAHSGVSQRAKSFTIDLTDGRSVISRRISRTLLLRLVKARSVESENFGWDVEVVRAPYRRDSENLVYANAAGKGPDPSMVYAWHVADRFYPNVRVLPVRGSSYVVRLVLVNPRVNGSGPKAWFISGKLTVSWRNDRSAAELVTLARMGRWPQLVK